MKIFNNTFLGSKDYYYVKDDKLEKKPLNFFQIILRNYFNWYKETHLQVVAKNFCLLDLKTIQNLSAEEDEIKGFITAKYSIEKTNEIFAELFLKRQSRYTVEKIEERFALALDRLRAKPEFRPLLSNFAFNEELKKRAEVITSFIPSESEAGNKIANRLSSKIHRKPTEEELRAKLYGISLRVQLECMLSTVEGPLPNEWAGSKFSKEAPHLKIFGEKLKVISVFNKNPSLQVKGQSDKIALIYNPKKIEGSFNTAQQVVYVNGGGEFIARELKTSDNKERDTLIRNVHWKKEINVHKKLVDLKIPGIVGLYAVYSSGEEEGKNGLILEKCDGDLSQLVGKIDESKQCLIMKQVLTTLNAMHSNNIVHEDVKLENIFFKTVDNDFEIKMGDFGFSTTCGRIVNQRSGTPIYKPWEGFLAKAPIGPNMDTWATGLIAYQLRYSNPETGKIFDFDEASNLDAQYLQIITKMHNLNKNLKSLADRAKNNISLIAAVRKYYPCQEVIRSSTLNNMTKELTPADLGEIRNEIVMHYFRPQIEQVLVEIRKKLSNDPYDQMIAGLLQTDPVKRITLEQALALIS